MELSSTVQYEEDCIAHLSHSEAPSHMTRMSERKIYPWPERDPLIDVIETKDTVRVIVATPGIKNEDLWLNVKEGLLIVEITKCGQVYRKVTPCGLKDGVPIAKNTTIHNSVLELVFEKKYSAIKKDHRQTIS